MFGSSITYEHAMTKCWTLEPTTERIVDDISFSGCHFAEDRRSEALPGARRGPALWASPGKVEWGRAVQGQDAQDQRIATLKERPTHPTALRALDLIAQEADEEFERLDAARLQHELLAFVGEGEEEEVVVQGGEDDEEGEDNLNLALDPDSDEEPEDGGGDDENGAEGDEDEGEGDGEEF